MGYTHGNKWNDKNIAQAIIGVMQTAKITSFPSQSLMKEVTGNVGLSNAISRHGGTKYWADKLGLDMKPCESKIGFEYECECLNHLTALGYDCELTKARYPYDLIVNRNIKIDVKCSNLYESGKYYTFNLEKAMPTCDVFVCYCISNDEIKKAYVIPSCVLSGITQLSIGKTHSKYDKYISNWSVIDRYDEFYKRLTKE
jgi:hypothetical protein